MENVKIAVLGFGTVGTGVCKIINMNREEILKRSGCNIEVSKILVRNPNKVRDVDVSKDVITTNPNEIFEDESIKIVVELMGGIEPAREYILKALRNKKHVVTANKALISTYGDELLSVAEEEGVMLHFEASVAGGIPIIHGINESLTANKIEEITGIINGTTNYILSKMTLEGMEFEEALKEAQEKGYAEADPTSDIEGFDAVYKLTVLASLAFGTKVSVESVYREGITKVTKMDIQYARELGYVVKLLAMGKEVNGVLELRVHPTFIPLMHPLANVNDVYNAIFIKGNAIGDLMLYGRGAGDMPTGSAVVSDIISILRYNLNNNSKVSLKNDYWDKKVIPMEETESEYYLRFTVKDKPGVLGEITTIFGQNGVSLYSVIQKGNKGDEIVPLVFIIHKITERNLLNAIEKIKKLPYVNKLENIIRVKND